LERAFDTLGAWLIDVYVISTVMVGFALIALSRLRQPARRMAVSRSVAAGLAALSVLAAAPARPRLGTIDWNFGGFALIGKAETLPAAGEPAVVARTERETSEPISRQPVVPQITSIAPARARPDSVQSVPSWPVIVGVAFAIGAALNLAWLAVGAFEAVRLRHSTRLADSRLQKIVQRIAPDPRKTPRVRLSATIGMPVAIGLVRATIVLPELFAQEQTDDCLEAALAHEWAHIRNGDLRWLALLRLLNVVLYAQPLFWWLRRTIRADQEALADAAASTLHGDGRLAYAETLVGWARSSHRSHPGALASAALALWERPSMLQARVRLLLDRDYRVEEAAPRYWKLAAACLGTLAALMLSMVTLRPSTATAQEMKAQPKDTRAAGKAAPNSATADERFEYAGRVVDPDGKPFAGAKLHLAHFRYGSDSPARIRATSDSDGRFRFIVEKGDFEADHEEPWHSAQVVARAVGFGPGWANTFKDSETNVMPDPRNLTIALARDDVPISGRLVDLQGRPVAGALIRPGPILEPEHGDLTAWIAASKSGKDGSNETERAYLTRTLWRGSDVAPPKIVTDAQGRFSIIGVGRERVIEIKVSGPMVQSKEIKVLTRDVEPFRVTSARGSSDWGIALYYGARFTHAAAPTKPVAGIVKDRDTGKPLAGVRIASDKTAEFPVHGFNGIETTTGQDGRYSLVGLPKGKGNHFIAIPGKGQPHLAAGITIPDTPGLEPVVLDIRLKRGIVIEGRVTDKETGEPKNAFVEYNAFRDNPQLKEAAGFDQANVWGQYKTEPDGTYRIVALPGRGVISAIFLGASDQYLTGIGLKGDPDNLPIVPNAMQGPFNVLSEIDLPKDASNVHHDFALERGLQRTIRVVDPDGRPVPHARIQGHIRFANWSSPHETPEFQIKGLRRGEKRRLYAVLEERKLAGWAEFLAEDKGTVELTLRPWATVAGRFIEDDGEPRAHVVLVVRPGREQNSNTDSFGRFHIEGLIPGVPTDVSFELRTYIVGGNIARGLVFAPGEVKDLGDVKRVRP
jgi:beta-lactamase regulating signal transducer with metallopeptidase domain